MNTLEAQNLCWKGILQDVSFTLAPQSWTHVIGPNGAGKSSLLKLLAGLEMPDSGAVLVEASPLKSIPFYSRARIFSYVPQRLEALPEITVSQFVAQSLFAHNQHDPNCIMASLQRVGIAELAERRLSALSGGERQRAVVAAAIAQDTPIIIMDEPTSALDIAQKQQMNALFRSLVAQGKTLVTVTHDLEAAASADYTLLLEHGKLVWSGAAFPPAEVLASVYQISADYFIHLSDHCKLQSISDSALKPSSAKDNIKDDLYISIKPRHYYISFGVLVIILLVSPFIGASVINPFDLSSIDETVFWQLRIPRVCWGAVSGATLACVGAALQAMLQNPLATPYTLGLASGASFGVMVAISLGVTSLWILPSCAMLGASVTMAAVFAVTARFGFKNPVFCLLAGVSASLFCTALCLVMQAMAEPLTANQMMRWQMGGLDVVGYTSTALFPFIAFSLAVLYKLAKPLNLIAVDASIAQTRGVSVSRVRSMALIFASLATALVVSICGPISFVGLLVPMTLRQRYGADLRSLLPLCASLGAVFILISDIIARALEATASIPVGVVVSIIGVPAVIFLLRFNRNS